MSWWGFEVNHMEPNDRFRKLLWFVQRNSAAALCHAYICTAERSLEDAHSNVKALQKIGIIKATIEPISCCFFPQSCRAPYRGNLSSCIWRYGQADFSTSRSAGARKALSAHTEDKLRWWARSLEEREKNPKVIWAWLYARQTWRQWRSKKFKSYRWKSQRLMLSFVLVKANWWREDVF